MKIAKREIEQKLKALEKAHKERGGGPMSRLFDSQFQQAFIKAIIQCGDNGSKIQKFMNENGHALSYKQAHVYMRRLFGTYPVTGRPPKYLSDSAKRKLASSK